MKKFLVGLLALACIATSGFAFTACGAVGGMLNGESSRDDDLALDSNTLQENSAEGQILSVNAVYAKATELGFEGTLEEFLLLCRGADGKDGVGIVDIYLNKEGSMCVLLSDRTLIELGNVKGEKGEKGDQGEKGEQGVGIASITVNEKGELVITLTDGTVLEPIEITVNKPSEEDSSSEKNSTAEEESSATDSESWDEDTGSEEESSDKDSGLEHVHVWVEDEIIEPTCEEEGITIFACACGDTYEERSDALGHDEIRHAGQEPTCTESGWTESVGCGRESCRYGTESREIPATGHNWDNDKCSVCGTEKDSDGLEYMLSDSGTYYSLTGIGSCTDVIIPSTFHNLPVREIDEQAFYACGNSLTSLTIGDNITTIGDYMFFNFRSLTSVTIGDSVTSIGDSAFSDCWSLTSVTIGDSVTSIGEGAFAACNLTSVVIPDSVTSIGAYAFGDCSGLTSVTIGNGVTSIGEEVFRACGNLTSLTFKGSVTEWNAIEKGDDWNLGVPATEVVCSDGTVTL